MGKAGYLRAQEIQWFGPPFIQPIRAIPFILKKPAQGKLSPCTNGQYDFPVSNAADGNCTISSSIGGSKVVPIYYTVTAGVTATPGVSAPKTEAGKAHIFTVKGCPACPVMMGSTGDGDDVAQRSRLDVAAGFPIGIHISCSSGITTPTAPVNNGQQITWIEDDGEDWTVAITTPLPCDKSAYTSILGDSNSSVCTVSANASVSYNYSATTKCNNASTTFNGKLPVK